MTTNPFASDYSGPAPTPKPAAEVPVETPWSQRTPLIIAPGFYPDLTPNDYFGEPCPESALTNSLIKLLSPEGAAPAKAAYHHPAIGQPPEERAKSKAMYMGSLVHRLALDKGDEYVLSPYAAYQSNEAKAWKKDIEDSGRIPVKQTDLDAANEMATTVRGKIAEACQGFPYQTEVVMAWQEEVDLIGGGEATIWCRGMLDVWCPDLMLALDVKTCRDATDVALNKVFYNGYATQDGFYLRGLNAITGKPGVPRFGFLFVENEPPHLHRVAASTESFRHGAKIEIERAMTVFGTCLTKNNWPSYEPYAAYPTSWQLTQYTALEIAEISVYGIEGKK